MGLVRDIGKSVVVHLKHRIGWEGERLRLLESQLSLLEMVKMLQDQRKELGRINALLAKELKTLSAKHSALRNEYDELSELACQVVHTEPFTAVPEAMPESWKRLYKVYHQGEDIKQETQDGTTHVHPEEGDESSNPPAAG